ncbi:class B sortase [Salinicoccus roseus]|uniref:Class B sortase n=1 Tax=Salinicoccus roseus TaxID=45670 RepID=A0ABT4YEZ1_9STAP|nr:class B sortase [Salinicoccus roseus]MDB0579377.1 class B sortase [Salinicoccus roseus]
MKKLLLFFLGILMAAQLGYLLFGHFNPSMPREVPDVHSTVAGMDENSEENIEEDVRADNLHARILNSDKVRDIDVSGGRSDHEAKNYEFSQNPFAEYLSMNPDFTGWITVDNTNIDYPIVKGRDNSYYLKHNFYHEPDSYGAIFMDHRNIGNGHDDHTVIYGHHTDTGHMFADFEKYLSPSFYKDNKTIEIQDLYKKRTYEIFSIHTGPADLSYINQPFQNSNTEEYAELLRSQSIYDDSEVPIGEDAKLLTLISCNYSHDDGRLYVHAVEVTE